MTGSGFARALLSTPACRRWLAALGRSARGAQLLQRLDRYHRAFPNFADAWAAAADRRYPGHDHPDAIENLLMLAQSLRPSDYAALYWLARIDDDLRVFDFGGNVGNLYYSYRPYLSPRRLEWTSYDLPAIIASGRRIAAERGVDELRFSDRPQAPADTNVLLISGALHYWEGSIGELFERLESRPSHVLVNRTPVHETAAAFITLQRQDHFAVPCLVRNAGELIAAFTALGYTLVNRWSALELSLPLPLFPAQSVPAYSGFYFCR